MLFSGLSIMLLPSYSLLCSSLTLVSLEKGPRADLWEMLVPAILCLAQGKFGKSKNVHSKEKQYVCWGGGIIGNINEQFFQVTRGTI